MSIKTLFEKTEITAASSVVAVLLLAGFVQIPVFEAEATNPNCGNATVSGTDGDDSGAGFFSGTGVDDTIKGKDGNDTILDTDPGTSDHLCGQNGNDSIFDLGGGADFLKGGDGDDLLDDIDPVTPAIDTYQCGPGEDSVFDIDGVVNNSIILDPDECENVFDI